MKTKTRKFSLALCLLVNTVPALGADAASNSIAQNLLSIAQSNVQIIVSQVGNGIAASNVTIDRNFSISCGGLAVC